MKKKKKNKGKLYREQKKVERIFRTKKKRETRKKGS